MIETLGLLSVPVLLAVGSAAYARSWRVFFLHLVAWTFGLWIPFGVFVLSGGMEPEWKGDAEFGWWSCWITTKRWLTPLVLWASLSLYVSAGFGVSARWARAGLLAGALTATICAMYGVVTVTEYGTMAWFLLVPVWTAALYVWRTVRAVRAGRLTVAEVAAVGIVAAPTLVMSVIEAREDYAALPDQPPDCFVVTAASRGEPAIVGPFYLVERGDRRRVANRQLLTFWAFEAWWTARAPRSHTLFRRIYGRVGPLVARRIRGRVTATVVWGLLRPVEAVAGWCLGDPVRPDPVRAGR